MDMLKIGIIGIVGILTAVFIKGTKPEFAVYISMATCILIFFFALSRLEFMMDAIATIKSYVSIKSSYISTLMKIVGITYISEFASGICKDAGYQAIAGQIEIFGKLSILAVSTPVLLALLETINGFLA